MPNGGNITYGVKFDVDKQQLTQLKAELAKIQNLTESTILQNNPGTSLADAKRQLYDIKKEAGQVQAAITSAFNPKLGSLNISKLQSELKNLNIGKIYEDFQKAGAAGIQAFNQIPSAIMRTNLQLKESHSLLDKIGNTMTNSIKWGITSRVVNSLADSIQGAWNYTKALDTSLNDIRIVTGKSAEEMEKFAIQANKAAQNLGASTKDYTNAALIYYQQGLDDAESQRRAEITLKTANVTGQSGRETSEQLTAIWNGYKVSAAEAELYIDKVAAVAAGTAADLEEMATGMSKVAAAANAAGVDIDQLNATLATVVSVTREAPETIGSAFKTIYARLGDLKLGKTDEDGVGLGSVSKQLDALGVQILNQNGDMRDMGDIIEDIAAKWQTWTRAQQQAAAVAMAGKMQYSRLIALFDNWDMYNNALNMSVNAMGTLQEQQDIYMESTAAHLTKLGTAWEHVFDSFVDNKGINSLIDIFANLTDGVGTLFDAIGGGGTVLSTIGSLGVQVFSRQLAESINISIKNMQAASSNAERLKQQLQTLQQMQNNIVDRTGQKDAGLEARIQERERLQEKTKILSPEQIAQGNEYIDAYGSAVNEQSVFQARKKNAASYIKGFMNQQGYSWNTKQATNALDDSTSNAIGFGEADAIARAKEEMFNYSQEIEKVIRLQKEAQKATDSVTQAMTQYGENSEQAERAIEREENAYKALESQLESVKDDFIDISRRKDIDGKQSTDAKKIVDSFSKISKDNKGIVTTESQDEITKWTKNATQAIDSVSKDIVAKEQEINRVTKEVSSDIETQLNANVKAAKQDLDSFFSDADRTAMIQGFLQVGSAIGQIASAANALGNIKSILDNNDLSTWEKFIQIVMNLSMSIPMMANGFITLSKNMGTVHELMPKLATKIIALAAARKAQAGAETQATVTTTTLATAETAESVAAQGAAISTWELVSAIATLAAPVLAVAAAIGALVGTIYLITKAYNADAEAAQQARQAANDAALVYDELNQKAQDLKETISDYSDGIEQLKELTSGTKEYENALNDVNKKARELIETYKLYDDYSYENGIIKINPDALSNIQQQANQKARNALVYKYSTEIAAATAENNSTRTNLKRTINNNISNRAVNRDLINEDGTLLTGLPISSDTIDKVTESINKVREANIEEYNLISESDDKFKTLINTLGETDPVIKGATDEILKQKNAFVELANSTYAAKNSLNYYAQQITSGIISSKFSDEITSMSFKNGSYDSGRAAQISSVLEKMPGAQNAEKYVKKVKSLDLSGINFDYAWGNSILNDLVQQFADTTGATGLDKYKIDNDEDLIRTYAREVLGKDVSEVEKMRYKSGAWSRSLLDQNGNPIIDDQNDDYMRKQIYQKMVSDVETQQTESLLSEDKLITPLEKALDKAKEYGKYFGTDFSDGLLNALDIETKEFNFSNIFARIDPNEFQEVLDQIDYAKQMDSASQYIEGDNPFYGLLGLSEQDIKDLGFESGAQFIEAFEKGWNSYEWDVDKALGAAINAKGEEFDLLGLSKSKLEDYKEEVQDYAKNLMVVAENSDKLADTLETDADASVAVSYAVIKMNKAIDTLATNMKDWEDIIKNSTKESQEYAEAAIGIREAIADIYNTESKYVSNSFIVDHLEEIKKVATGDEKAIERLRNELSRDIIMNIMIHNEVKESVQSDVLSTLENLQTQIPDILIGTSLDIDKVDGMEADFMKSMQHIIDAAGLTAEQANALFNTMGFQAAFKTEEVPTEQTVPEYVTETYQLDSGTATYTGQDGEPKTTELLRTKTRTYQDGTYKAVGKMTAIAMETSTDGKKVPKITGLTKTSNGSMNNYSSINKGGGAPGGKKGGSSKPSKEKPMDKKTDLYHDVNIQLALTNSKLKMVQSQTDKAFGADKIKNYNNQLRLLNQQLDQTKQKLKIAQREQSRLGGLLASRGATFNADGTIANYEQLYKQELAKVNTIIDNYNGMSKEQQESYKDTLDAAKEDFSKFEEQLKDYDDTVSSIIPELQQNIQDAIDEQIELNIKKFNMEFEIRLDMTEAKKDWNEFKKKIIDGIKDDNIFGNARARAIDDMSVYLDPNGKGQLAAGLKQTQEVLNELRQMDKTGWSSVYGDNRTQALEDLQTAYKDIEQSMLEMQQIQDDVHQAWLDTMDEINEKMSDQVAMYEQVNNIIEHDKKIIEMVYGETDFDALGRMYEKQHQNNLGLLDFQKQNAEFWEREMNSIVDRNSEAWKKAKENWISAVNDLNATIEDSISLAREKLENAIDGAFDKFNKQITNGKGLDYVKQQWDLINDVADDYLDTVNASFGIRELERKYQNAIDSTDNVSSQRKLNELMQKELSQLRDKDKLTEYDIERAKKRYELELKRLALEEAQNTKTKMRLRRDSQGNYRYEYIADEDNIKKLQDEIDALENSLYNFDKERFISLQNEIVGYIQDRENAIKEIQMDASLTEEERQARIVEINRLYNDLIQDITDQTVTAQTNLYQSGADELNKIWEQEGKDFSALNQEQQRIMVEEMIPQFASGVHDMIEQFKGPDGFEKQTTDSMTALSQATQDYINDLRDVQNASGEVFDDVEEGIDKNIPKTEDLIEANDELHDQYQDQIDAIRELNSLLDANMQKYKGIAEAAKSAATEAYNYWMKEQQIASEKAAEEKKNQDSSTQINNGDNNNTNSNSNKGHSGSSSRALNEDTMSGIAGAIWVYGSDASGWGTGATRKARLSEKFGASFANQVQDYINSHQNANNWKDWNQLKNYYYSTFRTGGYTGDWTDDDGKLAILHKKELVLNAHDTENMLNMMQIARDVVAAAGPNMISPSAGRYYSAAASDTLEQNVHIEANFPNVESASEIKEALNNLVNLAAQRANRKNR